LEILNKKNILTNKNGNNFNFIGFSYFICFSIFISIFFLVFSIIGFVGFVEVRELKSALLERDFCEKSLEKNNEGVVDKRITFP